LIRNLVKYQYVELVGIKLYTGKKRNLTEIPEGIIMSGTATTKICSLHIMIQKECDNSDD